jgi:hypothetical protein
VIAEKGSGVKTTAKKRGYLPIYSLHVGNVPLDEIVSRPRADALE